MQISFFEEYPTKENLEKIKYVKFPTKLYIAAKSLKEFQKIKVKSKRVKEKVYWPILEKKEGYWFSPFSRRKAMLRIFKELKRSNVSVMIDAELPTHPYPFLFFTQSHNFFRNRKLIRNFVAKRKKVYTAEYFPSSKFSESVFNFMGLSFNSKNHYPIKMIYSSMHDFGETMIRREIKSAQNTYGKRLRLAFGTMGHGVLGFEPVISKKLLRRDLAIAKDLGVKEVIIFRLGGLTKSYSSILEKFV